MPEGDPIEEVFVRMGFDAGSWLDDYEASLKTAIDKGAEAGQEIGTSLAQGLGEGFGKQVAETATDLGVSMEAAAEAIKNTGQAANLTADQLANMGRQYQQDLLNQFVDLTVQANTEVKEQGKVSEETAQKLAKLSDALAQATAGNKDMAEAAAHAAKQATEGGSAFGQMGRTIQQQLGQRVGGPIGTVIGSLGKMVPAAIAAVAAFEAFDEVRQFIKGAVDEAIQLSATTVQLSIAVRANQRAIGEQAGSIKEWIGFAEEQSKKYGVMYGEILKTVAVSNRLTSEMHLTAEEQKRLIESSIVFAQVTGQDTTSALTQQVFFLNTGYARGLARMGLNVGRAAQQQEALALGIHKPIKAWTTQEARMIRTSLLLRQTDKYAKDVAESQGAMAKQIEGANVELDAARRLLGEQLAPAIVEAQVSWTKFVGSVVTGAADILSSLELVDQQAEARKAAVAALEASGELNKRLLGDPEAVKHYADVYNETLDRLVKEAAAKREEAQGILANAARGGLTAAQQDALELQAAVDDAETEIEKSLGEITKDFEKSAKDIEKNFYKKLAELDAQFGQDMTEAAKSVGRDLADIDQQAAQDKAERIRDSQVEELRATQDHYIRLKELERQYLFDLEDAVRERDARGVLMAQRKYNTQKQDEEESFALAEKRRREDLQRELEDIERARQLRRAERRQQFLEEQADLIAKNQAAMDAAKEAHDLALEELRQTTKETIEELIASSEAIQNLSSAGLTALAEGLGTLLATSSGEMHDIVQAAYDSVTKLAQAAVAAEAILRRVAVYERKGEEQGASPVSAYSYSPYSRPISGHAMGANFVATSPQVIQVGERPERVSVTPLNAGTGGPLNTAGFGGGSGGKLQVNLGIRLSPGLEAEMLDKAMSEVADVVVSMVHGEPTGFGGAARPGGRQ